MGVHEGHRERLKARFLEHGLNSFSDIEALELLLFYAIPRRDTNELAHLLIKRFGSLSGVLAAEYNDLKDVPGVGSSAATLIKLVPQMLKLSRIDDSSRARSPITSSQAAGDYFIPRFMFEDEEIALLACLDPQKRVIACTELARGVVDSVQASPRRIVETALKFRASSVILAHNHPGSIAQPSEDDLKMTQQICSSLALVGITLTDHIIVAGEDYVSLADAGMINSDAY